MNVKFEYTEADKQRLKEIGQRCCDIHDWNSGRSLHPFKDSHDFACHLATAYTDDIFYLLRMARALAVMYDEDVGDIVRIYDGG